VAKNPLEFASIWALIFQALRTRHYHGKKVMFCARELTAHFPSDARATPAPGKFEVKRLGALEHSHDGMAVSSSGYSASNFVASAFTI